jgi:hypothetical protein
MKPARMENAQIGRFATGDLRITADNHFDMGFFVRFFVFCIRFIIIFPELLESWHICTQGSLHAQDLL